MYKTFLVASPNLSIFSSDHYFHLLTNEMLHNSTLNLATISILDFRKFKFKITLFKFNGFLLYSKNANVCLWNFQNLKRKFGHISLKINFGPVKFCCLSFYLQILTENTEEIIMLWIFQRQNEIIIVHISAFW